MTFFLDDDVSDISIRDNPAMGLVHSINTIGYPYLCYNDSGFLIWINDRESEEIYNDQESVIKEVYTANNYDNEEYKMKDKTMTINDALNICDEFTDGLAAECGYPKLYPYKISVKKYGGYHAYEIEIAPKVNDIVLRSFLSECDRNNSKTIGRLNEYNSNPYGYTVIISSSKGVSLFSNNENVFDIYQYQTELKKIVTPDSALRYIDNNLADMSSYKVKYMGLENVIYSFENDVYSVQPMWVIKLYSIKEKCYYLASVDCETGDFSFFNKK